MCTTRGGTWSHRNTPTGRTEGGPSAVGKHPAVTPDMADCLRREERLHFKHDRVLGGDTQPLLRSDESWAQPLKPSDEVLGRFDVQGVPTNHSWRSIWNGGSGARKSSKPTSVCKATGRCWCSGPPGVAAA